MRAAYEEEKLQHREITFPGKNNIFEEHNRSNHKSKLTVHESV